MIPVSFYGPDYGKQKGPGTSWQSLFGLRRLFRKIPFLVFYHLGNFDNLIQVGFWVVTKITFAELCKPIHDVIIIPVSSDTLNLETMERKEKNTTNWIFREWK